MNVLLRRLAACQDDVVAAWQLLEAGATRRMIDQRVDRHGWRVIHPGVYALTNSPLTRRQLWFAATLTAPNSVLSHASAAACFGFRPFKGRFEIITRPGSGGPKRIGSVLVFRSSTLEGDTSRHDGIAMTTGARTLIDLAPFLDERATKRAFREALRLRATTTGRLLESVGRCHGRRRSRLLTDLATRYATIPYARTRSNAEALALELLHDAGVPPPRVNVRIAGEEADLSWPDRKRIIEIDGPQYHRFRDEDARKELAWSKAGYVVRRIASQLVYDRPDQLLALARY